MPANTLNCAHCGSLLRTADPAPAGKLIECPKCNSVFRAPGAEAHPQPVECRIQCTHCGAVLKSSQPLPPGKLVQCRTCTTIFAVPAARPTPSRSSGAYVPVAEAVPDEGWPRSAPAPKSRPRPADAYEDDDWEPGPSRRRLRKKPAREVNTTQVGILVAAGVVLLMGVGLLAVLGIVLWHSPQPDATPVARTDTPPAPPMPAVERQAERIVAQPPNSTRETPRSDQPAGGPPALRSGPPAAGAGDNPMPGYRRPWTPPGLGGQPPEGNNAPTPPYGGSQPGYGPGYGRPGYRPPGNGGPPGFPNIPRGPFQPPGSPFQPPGGLPPYVQGPRPPDFNNRPPLPGAPRTSPNGPGFPPGQHVIRVSSGTGFVIYAEGRYGYLLTNNHVIEGGGEVLIHIPNKDQEKPDKDAKDPEAHGAPLVAATIVMRDPDRDVALLKIKIPKDVTLRPLSLSPRKPSLGQAVAALGYPLGVALGTGIKMATGIISALPEPANKQMLLLDARINPGNSGGPICDNSGCVVGMVKAKLVSNDDAVESYGMAIPAEDLRNFAKHHLPSGYKPIKDVGPKKDWDEVGRRASSSVLMIVHARQVQ